MSRIGMKCIMTAFHISYPYSFVSGLLSYIIFG